jgi:hypothetical protein
LGGVDEEEDRQFMFFDEIADHVAPVLGEFVSSCHTAITICLCCSTYPSTCCP